MMSALTLGVGTTLGLIGKAAGAHKIGGAQEPRKNPFPGWNTAHTGLVIRAGRSNRMALNTACQRTQHITQDVSGRAWLHQGAKRLMLSTRAEPCPRPSQG